MLQENTHENSQVHHADFGVISEIQKAEFGILVTYIFGGKIWDSDTNFRGRFWGQAPRLPNMEVTPLGICHSG